MAEVPNCRGRTVSALLGESALLGGSAEAVGVRKVSTASAVLVPKLISRALVVIAFVNVALALLWVFAPNALKYDGAVALASALAVLTGTVGGLGEYKRRSRDRFMQSYRDDLRSSHDLEELLRRAIVKFENITHSDYNQIMLTHYDGYSSSLLVVADSIAPGKPRYRITSFRGLVGQVVGSGVPFRQAVRNISRYMAAVPSTEAELIVAIRLDNGVPAGVLNSESDDRDHFTSEMELRSDALALAIGSLLPQVNWNSEQPQTDVPWIKRTPGLASQ
jgi:hypothetical protein